MHRIKSRGSIFRNFIVNLKYLYKKMRER
uniref:NdhJ n=1 Tax=Desmanthodium fruticosum TaxID=217841 RepID=F5XUR7_DESFU|nr:NdhJ [Desmanthodium fruticosum]